MAPGLAGFRAKPRYRLSGLESRTWGSQPLTILYLPGSPFRHGHLSARSDSDANDHSLTPTPGFGSSFIRQPSASGIQPSGLVLTARAAQRPPVVIHNNIVVGKNDGKFILNLSFKNSQCEWLYQSKATRSNSRCNYQKCLSGVGFSIP